MPISLSIDQDLSRATAWSKAVQKQLPFATKNAVNDVAFHARAALNSGTKGAFHVPVKFTQNAFVVQKAKDKRNVIAIVHAQDKEGRDRARYLRFGIVGGSRPPKGFEVYLLNNALNAGDPYFMPTSLVKTNPSGNITTATLRKITAGIDKGEFFAGTPRGGNRPAGIYRRLPQVLQPYFIATSARPSYTGRFNIEQIGTKVIQRKFGAEFDKALSRALATAR